MKQTSIEWLVDQLFRQGYFDGNKPLIYTNLDHLQQQAKEMHKQEIIDAYYDGGDEMCPNGIAGGKQAEQYYNQTYGGDK